MATYVVLLRGVNVGGKNTIAMAALREALTADGFTGVRTYIQSGNVLVGSTSSAAAVAARIEELLLERFELDSELVRTLALGERAYRAVVAGAPDGFGDEPDRYRYDVIFLMGVGVPAALKQIPLRDGIETAWPGRGVVYVRRPAANHPDATRGRLNRIAGQPVYASLTIRNWNTTRRLLALLEEA